MANRLTVITTRQGDDGTTGLADGRRLPKTHPRVIAIGTVDELNSTLGVLLAQMSNTPVQDAQKQAMDDLYQTLSPVQHALFDLGSELAWPGHTQLQEAQILTLDTHIERLNEALPPLKEFILPGGSLLAAQAHVVRTVCRRAERTVLEAANEDVLNPTAQQYLNRLSDLLFVVARCLNQALEQPDVLWRRSDTPENG